VPGSVGGGGGSCGGGGGGCAAGGGGRLAGGEGGCAGGGGSFVDASVGGGLRGCADCETGFRWRCGVQS
jgi:hypothetical protein